MAVSRIPQGLAILIALAILYATSWKLSSCVGGADSTPRLVLQRNEKKLQPILNRVDNADAPPPQRPPDAIDPFASAVAEITRQHSPSRISSFVDRARDIVVDIGLNNGKDTAHFLRDGHSVISVDANPQWVDAAKTQFSQEIAASRLLVLGVGLANVSTSNRLQFFVSAQSTRSSFSMDKASKMGNVKIVRTIDVPVIPCAGLFVAVHKRVKFVKIDIEELDYVCVHAIATQVPPARKPQYVSWENHFRRRETGAETWPAFDARLILEMAQAQYLEIKMSYGAGGDWFGPDYPEDITDCYTNITAWRSVLQFLHDGVKCSSSEGYYDFHMRRRVE